MCSTTSGVDDRSRASANEFGARTDRLTGRRAEWLPKYLTSGEEKIIEDHSSRPEPLEQHVRFRRRIRHF